MPGSPQYKVYNAQGQYIAACKHAEDAAAIINLYGNGATIRLGHSRVIWAEGKENTAAGESYDIVASTIHQRQSSREWHYRK